MEARVISLHRMEAHMIKIEDTASAPVSHCEGEVQDATLISPFNVPPQRPELHQQPMPPLHREPQPLFATGPASPPPKTSAMPKPPFPEEIAAPSQ